VDGGAALDFRNRAPSTRAASWPASIGGHHFEWFNLRAKYCGHNYKPGVQFAYVTTRRFLEAFGLASLRELPVLERLEEEGLLQGRDSTPISTGCWGSPKRTRRFSTMTSV
jgi:hypothetical protein